MTTVTAQVQAASPSLFKRVFKWVLIAVLALVSVVALLLAALYVTAVTPATPVGFQVAQLKDDAGKAYPVGIWYPTTAEPKAVWLGSFFAKLASNASVQGEQLPLLLISHGTGGGIVSHADLAMSLAAAGFVVAAPMHHDNYLDSSSVGSSDYIYGRSQQLRQTLDFMLQQWPAHDQLDAKRIAAYGFSIGAFTVLTSAGAKPDLAGVRSYCANHNEFACDLLKDSKSYLLNAQFNESRTVQKDPRIAAIVLAAPGLAFTMQSSAALADVTVPVQIWQGDKDVTVPFSSNAQPLVAALGERAELQLVPNAVHLSFLAPCGLLKLSPICADPADVDRAALHQQMNGAVLEFLRQKLPQG